MPHSTKDVARPVHEQGGMSFFGDIEKNLLGAVEGGAGNPQVASIAGQLLQAIPGMDDATKASLGQHITDALAAHHGTDAADIATQAGTTTEEVARGGGLSNILGMAQQHPEMLHAAMQAFSERNPSALMQFAPALMSMFGPK